MALTYRDTRTDRVMHLGRRGRSISMYVCGPTVYAPAHVGHARTYLYFDLVRRYFAATGVGVRHLMNITDVEDKIDQRARQLHLRPEVLSLREERRFFSDLDRLRVLRPTVAPRASDFVHDMIGFARRLERTGRVHRVGESWFYRPPDSTARRNFRVARELDRHRVAEPRIGSRPVLDLREFLVWKRQDPPRRSWRSPWGAGVPGWHLECYAMAERYFGVPIDLQGGGPDLVFPHHYAQNEIAFALRGTPFARGFLHTGFVLRDGSKMSKSVGNLVELGPALDRWGPSALRWYLLSTPRRRTVDWHDRDASESRSQFDRVRRSVRSIVAPGASGSLRAREVERLGLSMQQAIALELGAERAFALLRRFAERAEGAANGRIARGERTRANLAFRRIEALTGLELLESAPRAGRRA
ncbi:MAG: class I tRNA ligase family protein [Thermoplasmata archaeon]